MNKRFAIVVCFLFAALALLSGAAKAADDAAQPGEPLEASVRTPTPLAPSGTQTYTVFLPLVLNQRVEIIGPNVPFGYGWGAYHYTDFRSGHATTSFNWVKIANNPPPAELCGANQLTTNVLIRINVADANATDLQYVADRTWEYMQALNAAGGIDCVQAVEISNEPNLDSMYGHPVNPQLYADQLCASYPAIKAWNPNYIVVSGGIAPTGQFPDPTQVMDEEDFLRAMLNRIRDTHNGDAGACFDALGYHNYGFRTSYTTPFTDTVNCPEGMCFQSAERIWNILSGEYGVYKRLWLTEMGWTRDFTECSSESWYPVFAGFQNTDAEQAAQLVGAFQYARAHWPWAGAMFVFNLDFNQRPGVGQCDDEQNWFAVKGYLAQTALENMIKTP